MKDTSTGIPEKKDALVTEEEKKDCDARFQKIIREMQKSMVPDMTLLNKAYAFAFDCHNGQRRKGNGLPYITHPLSVALILAEVGFESDVIAAALLHDTIEDCNVTVEELKDNFGNMIASCVDAVSQVSTNFSHNPDIQKEEADALSDIKFLHETVLKMNRRAFYIKLADRIHNLKTIFVFDEKQQREKVLHTRNILIPAAKELHIYKLIDQLEERCLEIENPIVYKRIISGYNRLLQENAYTIQGTNGFAEYFLREIDKTDILIRQYVVSMEFQERYADSIYRNLFPHMSNVHDLERLITKEMIPLYNLYFTVSDRCPETPESIFFRFYRKLHESLWQITITGIGHTMGSGKTFYKVRDRYGNRYRLFIQTESELLWYSHGVSFPGEENGVKGHIPYINGVEPDEPWHKMIPIYRRDGQREMIEEGATVLDLAFHINTKIGLCARYAHINEGKAKMPLHTRLRPGDHVNIIADHDRDKPEEDIIHATLRWFEYLHTREAVRTLSRYMELHTDSFAPTIAVFSPSKNQRFDIPMGSTVLDFAVLIHGEKALDGVRVFLNKCEDPVGLDHVLRYNDRIRVELDQDGDADCMNIRWLGIARNAAVREMILNRLMAENS